MNLKSWYWQMISIQINVCPQTPVVIGYNLPVIAFIADKWEKQRKRFYFMCKINYAVYKTSLGEWIPSFYSLKTIY